MELGEGGSLACHTPQSQGKRDLVTTCTTSCTGDQIWSCPIRFKILNLLFSNTLLAAHTCVAGHAVFIVVSDVYCKYCILHEHITVCNSFSLKIEGAGA